MLSTLNKSTHVPPVLLTTLVSRSSARLVLATRMRVRVTATGWSHLFEELIKWVVLLFISLHSGFPRFVEINLHVCAKFLFVVEFLHGFRSLFLCLVGHHSFTSGAGLSVLDKGLDRARKDLTVLVANLSESGFAEFLIHLGDEENSVMSVSDHILTGLLVQEMRGLGYKSLGSLVVLDLEWVHSNNLSLHFFHGFRSILLICEVNVSHSVDSRHVEVNEHLLGVVDVWLLQTNGANGTELLKKLLDLVILVVARDTINKEVSLLLVGLGNWDSCLVLELHHSYRSRILSSNQRFV